MPPVDRRLALSALGLAPLVNMLPPSIATA
jgi:hypothetical protein